MSFRFSPEGKRQGSGLTVESHTVYCHTVVGYTNMEYANLTHLWPIRGPRAHASKSYTTSRIKGLVRRLKTLKSMRQQITQRSFRNLSMLCTDASCRPFHPLFWMLTVRISSQIKRRLVNVGSITSTAYWIVLGRWMMTLLIAFPR